MCTSQVENIEGYIEPGSKKPKKQRDLWLRGLGMEPVQRTAAGWPAVSGLVLNELAGDPNSACAVRQCVRENVTLPHYRGCQVSERAEA